ICKNASELSADERNEVSTPTKARPGRKPKDEPLENLKARLAERGIEVTPELIDQLDQIAPMWTSTKPSREWTADDRAQRATCLQRRSAVAGFMINQLTTLQVTSSALTASNSILEEAQGTNQKLTALLRTYDDELNKERGRRSHELRGNLMAMRVAVLVQR